MIKEFKDVVKFIKMSKSEHIDNGPYTLEAEDGWYNIYDKDYTMVGQAFKDEIETNEGS